MEKRAGFMLVWTLICLCTALITRICFEKKSVDPPPPSVPSVSSVPTLTKEEIADRVEAALRNAKYIEITADLVQVRTKEGDSPIAGGTDPIRVKSIMAKDAFKTLVYDKKNKLISAISLYEGKVQEYRPDMEPPLIEYDSPHSNGTDDIQSAFGEGCLFGGYSYSWVGVSFPNTLPVFIDKAWCMRDKVVHGKQDPDAFFEGEDYYVFRKKSSDKSVEEGGEDETIEDLVFVHKKTFHIARWDTFQPGVQRVRVSDIKVHADVPVGVHWRIDVSKVKEETRVGFPPIKMTN